MWLFPSLRFDKYLIGIDLFLFSHLGAKSPLFSILKKN